MAAAPQRQRAEETEAGLGHPAHQRAGELPRALPPAAGAGKWGLSCWPGPVWAQTPEGQSRPPGKASGWTWVLWLC